MIKEINVDGEIFTIETIEKPVKEVKIRFNFSEAVGNIVVKIESSHPLNMHYAIWKDKLGIEHYRYCDYDCILIPGKYYFAKDLLYTDVAYNNKWMHGIIVEANKDIQPVSWL